MHHSHIDRFAQGQSLLHHLDARVKLLVVLAYTAVLVSFSSYDLPQLAPLVVLPVAWLWMGEIPLAFALKRVLVLSPFILTLCLVVPWYDHSWRHVAIGPWSVGVSGGALTAASIAVKFVLGVLALTALMSTTPFAALLEAMRRLGAPRLLTMQLGFLYRYLFVLLDEAMRIRRGRDFRGAALAPVGRRLAAVGGIIGNLFVRTLERSDRIHIAMTARGYRGEPHALSVAHLHAADLALAALAAAYLVFCRWGYPAIL